MEQDKIINKLTIPEAIIILNGGTVRDQDGKYYSTSYKDGDAFGTLGGYVRVKAASILSERYPGARLITTGIGAGDGITPTHAKVMKGELMELGVDPGRIILEEKSTSSKDGLLEILMIAEKSKWEKIIIVSNEYHIPRVQTMWEMLNPTVKADFIAAEDIIISIHSEFKKTFMELKKTPAYIKRLESEARGLEALQVGTYKPAVPGDKKERLV